MECSLIRSRIRAGPRTACFQPKDRHGQDGQAHPLEGAVLLLDIRRLAPVFAFLDQKIAGLTTTVPRTRARTIAETDWLPRQIRARLYCEANGLDAIALPFAEMDRALCERLLPWATVVSDLYFKPRQAKGLIGCAAAAFTSGRYHPIVFSLSEDVPVFSIDSLRPGLNGDKTCLELVENGLENFFFHLGKLPSFDAGYISRHVARFRSGEIYGHAFATYGRQVVEASWRMIEILHS